jgi:hypothetical protein
MIYTRDLEELRCLRSDDVIASAYVAVARRLRWLSALLRS